MFSAVRAAVVGCALATTVLAGCDFGTPDAVDTDATTPAPGAAVAAGSSETAEEAVSSTAVEESPSSAQAPMTTEPAPADVAIIGDSMFAFGAEQVRNRVESEAGLTVIEYVNEAGTTTYTNSRLQPVIDADPDVLIVSFQLNDTVRLGEFAAVAGFRNLLDRAADIECVRWVTFLDEEPFGYAVDAVADLAAQYANVEPVPFNELLTEHPEWRLPAETAYGGDIHLDPEGGGPIELGRLIAESVATSDCGG